MNKIPKSSNTPELITFDKLEFARRLAPIFQQYSIEIRKTATVHARRAVGGEIITTIVDNHIETNNSASTGDFIITNQTSEKEQYIVKPENFNQRYTLIEELREGNAIYLPKLTMTAIQLTETILEQLDLPKKFYFIAPWGEKQFAEEGDYIVSNDDFTDIYRVCLSKFLETYELVTH